MTHEVESRLGTFSKFAFRFSWQDEDARQRVWALLLLGFVSFIPGAYVVFLALMAFCRRPGYSYSDIPTS